MLYIINLQPCAFLFYEQILKKVWTSEYDYFSVFVLLIDDECVILLYFDHICSLYSLSMLQISHLVISHLVIKLKKLSQ